MLFWGKVKKRVQRVSISRAWLVKNQIAAALPMYSSHAFFFFSFFFLNNGAMSQLTVIHLFVTHDDKRLHLLSLSHEGV